MERLQEIKKAIQSLSPNDLTDVKKLILDLELQYYTQNNDQKLTLASTQLSETILAKIWDNPEDADYDNL